MGPKLKTLLTHLTGVAAGGIAVASWTATKSIDIYGIYNQLNVVIADIIKLISTVTPLFTTAYAIYRTTVKVRLEEVVQDPKAVEIAKEIPPSPVVVAVADALKKGGN